MWIAIGAIGGMVLISWVITLFALLRVRELEYFVIVLSGVIMGRETNAEIVAYLKSRGNHPAGKKGVGPVRRMDEGDTPRSG